MQGDSKAAVAFLQRFRPDDAWLLTAIDPDKKGIETQTFTDSKAALAWIDKYNGQRNIYFSVNPASRALSKKAEREDIAAVEYLHVDIDPRAGEGIKAEQARALALLQAPPGGVPAPTVIIFSGGGYQGFWRLADPIPIDGDLSKAEDAKRYNIQLEVIFGADNCHNIDRIMRLPGTVNIPDERKRKRGREPALATLVSFADTPVALASFTKAPAVQIGGGGFAAPPAVRVSGNIARLDNVEALDQWKVPDRVKVIIVQGFHPDEQKAGDSSRSAWLFDCVCQLVRSGVPDELIFSIITDQDFKISASVLGCGSSAEKYALRQIQRAQEEVEEPWLRILNERHAVIRNIGGKCRVIEEVMDEGLNRTRLTLQSFDDFRNAYLNKLIDVPSGKDGKTAHKPLGAYWLQHPARREYSRIVFAPGKDVEGCYNLWRGFACESRPGDCSLFLTHIRDNICSGNTEHYEYLMSWMGRAVQDPASPGQTAIVLRGRQGTGKSFFAKYFGMIWGRHFLQVSDPKHLVGSFNSHLRDCVLLFGDEAFFAGDKKHESVLRMLITEEIITVEAKGVDAEAAHNYTHLILASNSQWVVPAGADERRFLVLDVADNKMQDTAYFNAIREQLEDRGGLSALLHMLLTRDLTGFNVRKVPKTSALHEQKLFSMTPEEEWWYAKLAEGRLLDRHDTWEQEVRKEELIEDYVAYARAFNIMRRGNQTILGKFFHKVNPAGWPQSYQRRAKVKRIHPQDGYEVEIDRRQYFYKFPTLALCRAAWDKVRGTKEEWEPEPEVLVQLEPTVPF